MSSHRSRCQGLVSPGPPHRGMSGRLPRGRHSGYAGFISAVTVLVLLSRPVIRFQVLDVLPYGLEVGETLPLSGIAVDEALHIGEEGAPLAPASNCASDGRFGVLDVILRKSCDVSVGVRGGLRLRHAGTGA